MDRTVPAETKTNNSSAIPQAAQGPLSQPQWCRSILSLSLPRSPSLAPDWTAGHGMRCRWSSTPHMPLARSPINQLEEHKISPAITLQTDQLSVDKNVLCIPMSDALKLDSLACIQFVSDDHSCREKTPSPLQTAEGRHDVKKRWHKAATKYAVEFVLTLYCYYMGREIL